MIKTVVQNSDVRMRVNLRTQNNLWTWNDVIVESAYLVNDQHPGFKINCKRTIGKDNRDMYLLYEGAGGNLLGDFRLKMMISYDGLRKTVDVPVFRVVSLSSDLKAYEYALEHESGSLLLTEDGFEIFIEQPVFDLEITPF